jgi:FkbM family methyltransferase
MPTRWDAKTPWGRVLRVPLALVPPDLVVPVLSGPARGMRWVVGSSTHGAWLGTLERRSLHSFVGRIRAGQTVWDVGAHVGLYTLPSARACGPGGRVFAFEPMPRNVRHLRRHVSLNELRNVVIVEAAVGREAGRLRMTDGGSSSECHVDPDGGLEVTAIALDQWRAASDAPVPSLVKIDVEGAEVDVLEGARETLARHRPPIYLSLHGETQRRACRALLTRWGYRVSSGEPSRPVERSDEWLAEAG